MRICKRESTIPVKNRSVKVSYENNTEIMSIQLVLSTAKVIRNNFRFSIGGK
jgi:hypothetical protein